MRPKNKFKKIFLIKRRTEGQVEKGMRGGENKYRKARGSSFFVVFFLFYLWLCWVLVSARGPSPVAASGGHSSSRCAGLSPSRPLPLRSTGSRRAGSAAVAHGPSHSAACGILPDQGSNPCPLHWQADSQPLRHQGSPRQQFCLTRVWIHDQPHYLEEPVSHI